MVTFNLDQIGATQVTNSGVTSNDADGQIVNAFASPRSETVDNSNAFTITNAASTYLWERNVSWRFTDAGSPPSAQITLTVPTTPQRGLFGIINDTSQDMAVQRSGQSSPPVLAAGDAGLFSHDGDVRLLSSGSAGTFLDLTDTPSSYSGQGTKAVAVNAGATALEFVDFPSGAGDALPFTLSPTWDGVRVKKSADQNAADYSTATKVPWNTVLHGTSSYFSDANDRVIVPAGVTKVRITGAVTVTAADLSSDVLLDIYKNGSVMADSSRSRSDTTSTNAISTHVESGIIEVVENDYFELFLHTVSDSSVNVTADRSWLQMEIIETTDATPSLRTVVQSLAARSRSARISKSAAQTSIGTALTEVTFDETLFDTDSIADLANNAVVVPAGATRVQVRAHIDLDNANTAGDVFAEIVKNDASIGGKGKTAISFERGVTTSSTADILLETPVLIVTEADSFTLDVQVGSDATADVGVDTWLELVVLEWATSTDAPVAYIAVSPEHKGVSLQHNGTETLTDNTARNLDGWDAVGAGGNSFDPGDGGPAQRFWLGADQTFTDGNVTVGTDNVAVTAHSFETGEGPVTLTSSGTLPTGLATATKYWIIRVDANTLQFATSRANAIAGTQVDITAAAGGGTHTIETAEKIVIPAGVARVSISGGAIISSSANLARAFCQIVEGTASTFVEEQGTSGDLSDAGARINAHAQVIDVTEGEFYMLRALQDSDGNETVTFANFALTVLEESRAITYPGVTVTPPVMGALVKQATAQTAQNFTTGTVIPFDEETYDTDGFHDNATNNTRLTIPTGLGITKVIIKGSCRLENVTASEWAKITILKNGAGFDGMTSMTTEDGGTNREMNIASPIYEVVDGDYFELQVQVQADTSVDINEVRTWLSIEVVELDTAAFPPEEIHFFQHGAPATSDVLWMKVFNRRTTVNDALAGSNAYALGGANGGAVVYDIERNGTKIGDVTFADTTGAAAAATFATQAAQQYVFDVGDRLTIVSPANIQSMTDISFNLAGFRS